MQLWRDHFCWSEDGAEIIGVTPVGRATVVALNMNNFYATKTLTTGEGGMITTDNDEWAERCRVMSLHGISKDAWKRYTAEGFLVLRDRCAWLQVQHDRCGRRHGPDAVA